MKLLPTERWDDNEVVDDVDELDEDEEDDDEEEENEGDVTDVTDIDGDVFNRDRLAAIKSEYPLLAAAILFVLVVVVDLVWLLLLFIWDICSLLRCNKLLLFVIWRLLLLLLSLSLNRLKLNLCSLKLLIVV